MVQKNVPGEKQEDVVRDATSSEHQHGGAKVTHAREQFAVFWLACDYMAGTFITFTMGSECT